MIVAQGGDQAGYSLYIKDGKLVMATRVGGQLTAVTSPRELTAGKQEVGGWLESDGTITLLIAANPVAQGKAPGLIPVQPVDDLEVGSDRRTAVGEYDAPNRYDGTIHGVRIVLEPSADSD